MTIYTRTGDTGTTSLFGGKKVLKSDPIIKSCGNIDELSSYIGLVATKLKKTSPNRKLLISIQKDLYQIMAMVAGAKNIKINLLKQVGLFEKTIDEVEVKLPRLNHFIEPGGTELSAWFHILRTVCRRAERTVVASGKPEIIPYLNRLSDLLFILARFYNQK